MCTRVFQSLYLNKLDICFLALEEILAGEPGSILVKVGQNLGLNGA
jgi:hypothetical protein